MSGEIGAFISILSVAGTMARGLVEERDRQKAAAIQIELSEKILQAQAKFSEILGTVIEKDGTIQSLRERIRELETNEAEKARYRLAKVGSLGHLLAYALRPASELAERADEPEHFVCQPCFDAGKKGVLHIGPYAAHCPLCNVNVSIEPRPRQSIQRRSAGPDFSRRDW